MTDKTTIVSLRLPRDVVRRIDATARQETRTRTGQISHVLQGWLALAESRADSVSERKRHG